MTRGSSGYHSRKHTEDGPGNNVFPGLFFLPFVSAALARSDLWKCIIVRLEATNRKNE
jgi:hypothetical protein